MRSVCFRQIASLHLVLFLAIPAAFCTANAQGAAKVAPVVTVDELVTNDVSPEITGTVNDPAATLALTVAGQALTVTNNGDGTWSSSEDYTEDLAEGVYDVMVVGDDGMGNLGSDSTTGELTVDTTPPVVTIDPLITNNNTPMLTGLVDDPEASIGIQIGAQNTSVQNDGDGTWSLPADSIGELPDGTYDVQVTAYDVAGNEGGDDSTDEVRVDTVAPLIMLNGPAALTLTAGEDTYTEQGADVTDAGDPDVTVVTGGATVNTAAPGTYVVTYNATDAAGNAAAQVTRTVTVVAPGSEEEESPCGCAGGKSGQGGPLQNLGDLLVGLFSAAFMLTVALTRKA